jgi:DNA glycosylase AlkZ-like
MTPRSHLPERLTAQMLAGPPASSPGEVAERLLAIQAQDPRGARLAIRARSRGVAAADVDTALTDQRSLVVTWLNRGTLHLVRREDYPWLHALTTPPLFTGSARRLAQEGVAPGDADRGVAAIASALADEGPLSGAELRERIAAVGVRTDGQALIQLLFLASLRGLIVRGPMRGARQAYALVRDWLGEPEPVERDKALAELARRYLAGHGPASDRDLARWAGLPLRDARAGLRAIARELSDRGEGLVDLARRGRRGAMPQPRMLGPFEPLLLGWTSRADVLGRHASRVVSGGIFRPIALDRGRAVGTWRLARGAVALETFAPLDPPTRRALDADSADVASFLGL